MDELKLGMQLDYESKVLCLEHTSPVITWKMEAGEEERGVRQTEYSLKLLQNETELWSTGPVKSEQLRHECENLPLQPETVYTLQLTMQDNFGRSATDTMEFRTGLMASDFSAAAWCGAKWIGTGTRSLWAPALSVFELSCDMQLERGTCSAELVFGANDPRLMDRDKNLMGLESPRFRSWISLQLDISGLQFGGLAALKIFRSGYAEADDPEQPLFMTELPHAVICADNAYDWHTVCVRSEYGVVDLYVDGTQVNQEDKTKAPGPFADSRVNLNPVGRGGDFNCYPNLCDIGVRLQPGNRAAFRNLTVRNYRRPGNVLAQFWGEPKHFPEKMPCRPADMPAPDWQKQTFFRIFDPSCHGLVMLRTEFRTETVRRAWLTITARGVYEVWLNGKKAGSDLLAPGLTQYNKTHLYQVYDVTGLLQEGENALAVELAEGWWSGALGFTGSNWNYWGDTQSVILKLTLEAEDGSVRVITSDPDRFTASDEGPDRYASLFQGQIYDAFYEPAVQGWREAGFLPGKPWAAAREIPLNEQTAIMGEISGPRGTTAHMDYTGLRVQGQIGCGVRAVEELTALSMTEPHPGVYVYDLGQNITGIPDITLPGGLAGQEVTLRYAELLYPEQAKYGRNQGMLMVENLRGALVTDVVYLGDAPVHFCPHFTFHGFRYLEITGLDEPLPPEKVRAIAISSVEALTAAYHCSDSRVNRLYKNIAWSLRDNFVSIPTDCPQRNERMGWSGDLSVFAPTAAAMCNAAPFLRRHMLNVTDTQHEDGRFPDIAPGPDGFGGILWGSVGMTVPYTLYMQYGDRQIYARHYDSMARYIRFLLEHVDEQGLQTAGELGDWLGPQNQTTETALLWMSYFAWDLKIMAQAAAVLEKPETEYYEYLAEAVRQRMNEVFFDPESHKTVYSCEEAARGNRMPFEPVDPTKPLPPKEPGGAYRMHTQTSYCVPLGMQLVSEAHVTEAGQHLAHLCSEPVTDDNGSLRPAGSLMTGFIGTAWLLNALSLAGRDDTAYRVLLNRSYPSWLYPVDQGATTIWERLDSYTLENGFGGHNSMNSFNHYSFGAVGQWLLGNSLGITHEEPGWQSFVLAPMPDEEHELTWAEGYMDTVCGRITSRWECLPCSGGTRYTVTVPAGTSCILKLRGRPQARVTESGKAPEEAPGVSSLGYNGIHHRYWLDSGTYSFHVTAF